jgi:hypothetical protein
MSCRGVLAKRVIFGGPQIWPKMTQNDPKSTHFGSYLDPILRETLNKRGHFGTYFGSYLGHIWVIFGPLQGVNPKRDIKQIDPFWVIFDPLDSTHFWVTFELQI